MSSDPLLHQPGKNTPADEGNSGAQATEKSDQPTPEKPPQPERKRARKEYVVAVDISHHHLTLVKIAKPIAAPIKITDYTRIPLEKLVSPNTPTFSAFLKRSLETFCAAERQRFEIWALIPSSEVEIRRLIVPNVARKLLSRTLFLALKRELAFDDRDYLFDYALQGKVSEGNVEKIAALVCVARTSSVNDLSEQFTKIGFPLAGITTTPLAMQNLFKQGWLPATGASCDLTIEENQSRINLYHGGALVMTRDIKTGIDSMVDQILDQGPDRDFEFSFDTPSSRTEKTDPSTAFSTASIIKAENQTQSKGEQARSLLFSLLEHDEIAQKDTKPEGEKEEESSDESIPADESDNHVLSLIEPVLSRLVRQTDSTIKHYIDSVSREGISQIYISGTLANSPAIVDYFARGLSIPAAAIESVILQQARQNSLTDESLLAPGLNYQAIGLAMSNYESDINFLYTYEAKEEKARQLRRNRAIFISFLIVSAAVLTLFQWQNHLISQRNETLQTLNKDYARYIPHPDQNLVSQMASKAIKIKKSDKRYAQKYLSMSIVNELIGVTPHNIKLKTISMVIGRPLPPPAKDDSGRDKSPRQEERRVINIEGIVQGRRDALESMLAGYIVSLSGSRLFSQPDIVNSFIDTNAGIDSLVFTLNMKIE